jgi:hypothetical protein
MLTRNERNGTLELLRVSANMGMVKVSNTLPLNTVMQFRQNFKV